MSLRSGGREVAHVNNTCSDRDQCSCPLCVPGLCMHRSSSLANTTSLRLDFLRSLGLDAIERTACSNMGQISSDELPRSETSFGFEPEENVA